MQEVREQIAHRSTHLGIGQGDPSIGQRPVQVRPQGRAAALVQHQVVEALRHQLLVDARGGVAAGQHAVAAARGDRRGAVEPADHLLDPAEVIGEALLIEGGPVEPLRAVRARQRSRVAGRGRRDLVERGVARPPRRVQPADARMPLRQPVVEHPLAAVAVANVLELVAHHVVEQLRVLHPARRLALHVLLDGPLDVRALEADDDLFAAAAHRPPVPDQMAAPAVPADALRIGMRLESLVHGRIVHRPAGVQHQREPPPAV